MSAPTKRGLDSLDTDEDLVQVKKSSGVVKDIKLNKFLRWCESRQFNLSSKVCVERERSCAQYGMVAVADISSGEVLFSVPRTSLLSPENSSIAELLQKGEAEIGGDNSWVPLLLTLLYEYNSAESPWRAYLDIVPDFAELDLPMFWSSDEREKLLRGTGVEEAVARDLTMLETDFNTKALPFMQKHSDVFGPACQSLDLYKKMVAFVMAYSFTEPAGKAKEADGNASREEEDSDTEDVEGTLPPMMVPMADILNHIAKNNAALTFEVDALRMVSTRDIRKGEEVFNTYGELANKHLLHMYGFAECYPNNHYDTVDIPVSIVTNIATSEGEDTDLMASKMLFLQEQGLQELEESYVVGMEGVLTDDELQAVLKVVTMSAEEFKEHVEKEGWSDAESDDAEQSSVSPLSFAKIPALPERQKKILSKCAEKCLSRLDTDEQQDTVAMKSEGRDLPTRARYAMYVRYGQRQLLRQLLDACR